MKKKKYEKPSIEVVVINKQPQLLAGSGEPFSGSAGFGGTFVSGNYEGGYSIGFEDLN